MTGRLALIAACALLFGSAGYLLAQTEPALSAFYVVAEEDQYGTGIRFFALQRVESKAIDRAVCSIDADLPLAQVLSALKGVRIRLTIEDARVQKLER